jgi:GDP-L-fucose synthase
MGKDAKILVAGAGKMFGRAIVDELRRQGCIRVLTPGPDELPLTDRSAVERWFAANRPEHVFLVGGKSGGIGLNRAKPATLMLDNLLIECHVIEAARVYGAQRLLFLASNCCYPRLCPQPMREDMILTGPVEPTNEAYSLAKISGIRMCEAYRREYGCDFFAAIPPNSFGPGDDFTEENSHVVGALMRRLRDSALKGAASVDIWGSGEPRREFLFSEDVAGAAVHAMWHYQGAEPINLGGGVSYSIRQLAEMLHAISGFAGELRYDATKPDGMPLKQLDNGKLAALGWSPAWDIRKALETTYAWFNAHYPPAAAQAPAGQAAHE